MCPSPWVAARVAAPQGWPSLMVLGQDEGDLPGLQRASAPPPLLRQPLSSTQQQAPPAQPPPNHTCTTKQARQAATGRKHRPRTFHKVKDAKLALNKRVATGQLRRGGARLLLRGRHLQEVRQGHMCWWMMMDEGMDEWAAASWGRPGAAARPASARGEAGAHAAMAGGSMG